MSAGTSSNRETTVIGPDTTIKGEMNFEGGATVLGTFEGRIEAAGELEVGESAVCRAELVGNRVEIDGLVEGNVHAAERLTLNASARIRGDITAGALIVIDGASFVGKCNVGPNARSLSDAAAARPASASASTATGGLSSPRKAAGKIESAWDSEAEAGSLDGAEPPLVETTGNGAILGGGRLGVD